MALTNQATAPRAVSVVVCTHARGPMAAVAVKSLLGCVGVQLEVIVIDQNTDEETRESLRSLLGDPRLRYVRSTTKGVSAARNVGIRMACHPIVLLTDDDVTVPEGWCRDFAAALAPLDRVAVAFCAVDASTHDRSIGFIPDHQVTQFAVVRSLRAKSRIRGMGAGMAVRRDAVLSFGGFDEQLGPGAPMRAAEDRDIAARALSFGWWICQTPDAHVVHHGFRTYEEGRELTRRDWYGIGAAYAKQVKCLNLRILPVIAHEVIFFGLLKPIGNALSGRGIEGFRRLGFFAAGFTRGLRTPLDRGTLVYRPRRRAV